jgi:hypothetical protein
MAGKRKSADEQGRLAEPSRARHLADALRENLKRRKAQARQRSEMREHSRSSSSPSEEPR